MRVRVHHHTVILIYIISSCVSRLSRASPAASRRQPTHFPPDAHTAAHLNGCPARRLPLMRAPLTPCPRQQDMPNMPPTHFCCLLPRPGSNITAALSIASLTSQPTPYHRRPACSRPNQYLSNTTAHASTIAALARFATTLTPAPYDNTCACALQYPLVALLCHMIFILQH